MDNDVQETKLNSGKVRDGDDINLSDFPDVASNDVKAALERVTSHHIIRKSPKLKAFLNFIVEEALAGRGHRLKAYSIGIAALGKHTAFDPTNDPIVRVEASRLRRVLNIYYATDGQFDPIRISIPSGSYKPVFERNSVVLAASHKASSDDARKLAGDRVQRAGARSSQNNLFNTSDIVAEPAVFREKLNVWKSGAIQKFILLANIGVMLMTIGFGFKIAVDVQNLNMRLDQFQKYWQQHLTARVN